MYRKLTRHGVSTVGDDGYYSSAICDGLDIQRFFQLKLSRKHKTRLFEITSIHSPLLSIYLYKTSKGALPAACTAVILVRDFLPIHYLSKILMMMLVR